MKCIVPTVYTALHFTVTYVLNYALRITFQGNSLRKRIYMYIYDSTSLSKIVMASTFDSKVVASNTGRATIDFYL